MAGDWIKMRTDLYRHPKVIIISDYLLLPDSALAQYMSRDMSVTPNVTCHATSVKCHISSVTRNVTVGALVSVWGVFRHRGSRDGDDLVMENCMLEVIDEIAERPGFGKAMQVVGWAVDNQKGRLVFPRFFVEHNVDPEEEKRRKAAERQRRCRERKSSRNGAVTERDVKRDSHAQSKSKSKSKSNNNKTSASADVCAEPPQSGNSAPPEPSEFSFDTTGKKSKTWNLPQAKLAEYIAAYPALDVMQEMRAARQWTRDNPAKRKTPGGMLGFLTRWLNTAQNRGHGFVHESNAKPRPSVDLATLDLGDD